MGHLPAPEISVKEVVEVSISNLRNGREDYEECIPTLVSHTESFDNEMKGITEWSSHKYRSASAKIGKDEMVSLYNTKFAKLKQPGRKFYDQIIMAATRGTCPLCGFGNVATLDHYMAKTDYFSLAVTPNNLIPACRDCNTGRGTVVLDSFEETTIHPYYDDVQSFEWLRADIVTINPFSIKYRIDECVTEEPIRSRLLQHLSTFDLSKRFATKAAEEIISMRLCFQSIFDKGGIIELRNFLSIMYESSHASEKNSWKTALYKALLDSDEIVSNGILMI